MIELALVGKKIEVVERGLEKSLPNKLYIMHTKDETDFNYEQEAKKLKITIENRYRISTVLVKMDAFDMDQIIKAILRIIYNEKKQNASLTKRDFIINITGGTKLMTAAA
ncbi:MAG TPA: hypothetical protein VH500_05505, partial [Nitrososphaeraceae archaeon]